MFRFELPQGFKIVSGGQTGADRAGLDWALGHHVAHGGWCPKGRRAEDGTVPTQYELAEMPRPGYLQRTEWNVRDSDATVIFTLADQLIGGSLRTAGFATKLRKPCLHISARVAPKHLVSFLAEHSVRTLNVAGNRESVAPGIYVRVLEVLSEALILAK